MTSDATGYADHGEYPQTEPMALLGIPRPEDDVADMSVQAGAMHIGQGSSVTISCAIGKVPELSACAVSVMAFGPAYNRSRPASAGCDPGQSPVQRHLLHGPDGYLLRRNASRASNPSLYLHPMPCLQCTKHANINTLAV